MAFDYTNYDQLQYIESSGTQYINTGLSSKDGYRYVGKMQVLAGNLNSATPFGRGLSYKQEHFQYKTSNKHFSVRISTKTEDINYVIKDNTDILVLLDSRVNFTRYGAVEGISSNTITVTDTIVEVNSFIFASNYNNSNVVYFKGRFYYLEMTDNSDIIVGHFIPAKRKSDNAIGMYDIIGENFYPNAGTGVFTAGPIVPPPFGVKFKSNGEWTDASFYIKIDRAWKEATPFIKINGTWKQGG